MESVSVVAACVSTLPSPSLKRKSPPSPLSAIGTRKKDEDLPSETVGSLELAAQVQDKPDTKPDAKAEAESTSSPPAPPRSASDSKGSSNDDFEKGVVVCETCGESVPFRDPQSGSFTPKLWELHREQCRSQNAPPPQEPIVFAPETTVDAMSNPPHKKRRAKRTEEERIEYLRTDPYVAQFEPYRVLCASCNKWIRLRPNSTYCSIPWDAHRKSCLSKKANAKAAHAADGRNAILYGDPDARRFDVERVLCAHCDRWILIGGEGGEEALRPWYTHRDECRARTPPTRLSFRQVLPAGVRSPDMASRSSDREAGNGRRASSASTIDSTNASHASEAQHPPVPRTSHFPLVSSASAVPHGTLSNTGSPSTVSVTLSSSVAPGSSTPASSAPSVLRGTGSPPSFKDLHPGNFTPAHESRRRNAEQREAVLRADGLLKDVEPNRVFCGLCDKWVQLRQDSSFCAYPWLQHRGKCLARHQRRQEKVQVQARARQHPYGFIQRPKYSSSPGQSRLGGDPDADGEAEDQLISDGEHVRGDPESEEDANERAARRAAAMIRRKHGVHHAQPNGKTKNLNGYQYPSGPAASMEDDPDADAEGDPDLDADGDYVMDDEVEPQAAYRSNHSLNHVNHVSHRGAARSEVPLSLADLDTPAGRTSFVSSSVRYLFRTTYERSDEMSVVALVNYLNAAMPTDKHEDFDVQEVTKAASSLAKSGALRLEGDLLRLP